MEPSPVLVTTHSTKIDCSEKAVGGGMISVTCKLGKGEGVMAIWGRGTKVPRPPDLLPQIACSSTTVLLLSNPLKNNHQVCCSSGTIKKISLDSLIRGDLETQIIDSRS